MALLGAALYAALVLLYGTLSPDLSENSNDLRIYHRTGEAVLAGELPYRDFFIEYPPGSVPAFVPPALLADDRPAYIDLFAAEMALALVAALFLTALCARRARALPPLVPAVTFAAGAVALYPVAVTRYDAVVTLTLALAACGAALGGRWLLLSYASLGYGAAAKLVPALAALPLALSGRRAGRGLLVFAAALGLFFVPALLFSGERFTESFAYHARRGVQVESLWATALMWLGQVSGIAFEYGAFEVRGEGAGLAGSLSLPVTAALLLVTALFVYRDHRAGRAGERFPRHAAALILAFMLGSKVLSPQYMLWLLPLVPLGLGGLAGYGTCALFLLACVLTSRIFPAHYADLLNLRSPGPELLLTRNLILVLLWALLLFLPEGPSREEKA